MEKFWKAWWRPLLIFSTLLFLFLGISHCTFKTPSEAPTWDVTLIVPLFDTTFTMQELADSTDELSIDLQEDVVILEYEEEIDSIKMGEYLKSDAVDRKPRKYDIPGADFPDTTRLSKMVVVENAKIESGSFNIKVTNLTPDPLNIFFKLYDLIDSALDTFSINTSLSPEGTSGDTFDEKYDLKDYMFSPAIDPQVGCNYISYDVNISGIGSAEFEVDIDLGDLYFSEISGWFNRADASFDTIDTELDLPEQIEGFKLGAASAEISINNQTGVPADIDLLIKAENEEGEVDSLGDMYSIAALGITPVLLDGLEKIINLFPNSIVTTGSVILNYPYAQHLNNPLTVTNKGYVKGDILIKAPLIFSIDKIENEMEVDTLEINEDAQDVFRDNFRSAFLVLEVHNHLPFGFSFEALFSETIGDSTLYDSTPDLIKSITVKPGKLGPDPLDPTGPNRVVVDTTISKIPFGLTKDESKIFENPEVYMGMRFIFPKTPPLGEFVKVRPGDYIKVRARAEATANTKIPEENNEENGEGGGF